MNNTATYPTKDVFNPFIAHSYSGGEKKDSVVEPQRQMSIKQPKYNFPI